MNTADEKRTTQIKGTRQAPAVKLCSIEGLKGGVENGVAFITGYANTKNHRDRYGDTPAVYGKLRAHVYDLEEFRKNPVLLLDHRNSVDCVAGSFAELEEDGKGLRFKAVFSDSDYPPVRHARTVYTEGHARGLSIAGRFHYENPDDPGQLTLAEIYEISLVAVPADPHALARASDGGKNASGAEAAGNEQHAALAREMQELRKRLETPNQGE